MELPTKTEAEVLSERFELEGQLAILKHRRDLAQAAIEHLNMAIMHLNEVGAVKLAVQHFDEKFGGLGLIIDDLSLPASSTDRAGTS